MDTIYYIGEVLQEIWWIALIIGGLFAMFMLAFDKESIESDNLGEYYDTGEHNFPPKEKEETNE